MPHPTPGALGAFPGQWLPDELLEENPRGKARRDAPAAMGDGSFAGSRDAREVPKVRLAPPSQNDACFRVTARARPTATLPARRHPERAPRRASCAPRGDGRAWLKSFPSAGRRHARNRVPRSGIARGGCSVARAVPRASVAARAAKMHRRRSAARGSLPRRRRDGRRARRARRLPNLPQKGCRAGREPSSSKPRFGCRSHTWPRPRES